MAENLANTVNQHTDSPEKTKIWEHSLVRVVKSGTSLVRYGVLTGTYKAIKNPGIKVLNPIDKYRVVPMTDQFLDTPPVVNAPDQDNILLSCDTDYVYRITKPDKYIEYIENESIAYNKKTTNEIIGDLLDNLVRLYLKSHKANDFLKKNSTDISGEFDIELDEIETKYGVRIIKMIVKDIKLPEAYMQKAQELQLEQKNKAIAQAKQEARLIELETKKLEAQTDIDIETKRMAEIIKASVQAVKEVGGNVDDMIQMIGNRLMQEGLVNGSNPNTFVVASALNQSTVNGQFNPNQMAAIIAAATKKANPQTADVTTVPDREEGVLTPLTAEQAQLLIDNKLADPSSAGFLTWEGLSTAAYDYLVTVGYNPPASADKTKSK